MQIDPYPTTGLSMGSRRKQAAHLLRLRAQLGETGEFENLGFARVDHGREARTGFPEVIFGEGKTRQQIAAIAARILARSGKVLITRIPASVHRFLAADFPRLEYHAAARAAYQMEETPALPGAEAAAAEAHILVLCAGTGDIPVAEEAALTARFMGCKVRSLHDVGVAGLHRLLSQLPALRRASVIIAVAGMEGALPSVVAGLVDKPVIGVPTSIGYGASMRGMAALLAILNSCAAGLTVVNIDNGFGAGFAAAQMLRLAQKTPPKTKQGKSPRQRVAKQAANRTTGKPAKKTAKRAAKSH